MPLQMIRIKKRTLWLLASAVLAALIISVVLWPQSQYGMEGFRFSYAKDRPLPRVEKQPIDAPEDLVGYALQYQSREFLGEKITIHARLYLPSGRTGLPGVVLLPGGGNTKEVEAPLAERIARLGYAVLTYDQRGLGETGGQYLGFMQDAQVFAGGQEPVQHLSVYDALTSFDVLRSVPEVDNQRIVMMGESMGGRYAIIAGALDDRIRGVIAISSAGFHVPEIGDTLQNQYLLSIDPDQYIGMIAPRHLVMLHGDNDTMVPLDNANSTYALAGEPKAFYVAAGCGHGFCDGMMDDLEKELAGISRP